MFKYSTRVGHGLKILVGIGMVVSAAAKLSGLQAAIDNFAHLGISAGLAWAVGIIELLCAVIFLIPRTSFVGAILVTAYFGGAVLAHVRIGEPPVPAIVLTLLAWVGYALVNEDVMRGALGLKRTT